MRLPDAHVIAGVSGAPDDLAITPAGDIWLSDTSGGRLLELSHSGDVIATISDLLSPEGIAVLPDGMLLVAQQAPDRIDLFDTAAHTFRHWMQLAPRAGVEGVDGIALEDSTVLVPDSARGQLFSVPLLSGDQAGAPHLLATGLGRPVDAVEDSAGDIYVATENRPGLYRVTASGATTGTTNLSSLDDVVLGGQIVYATDLADGSLVAIDPTSGQSRTLVTDSSAPQGLALLPDGQLLLVDSTAQHLVSVPRCV